jgi:thymidine phosphorylase
VTLALGAEVMMLAKFSRSEAAARASLQASLASGAAAERFARMVRSLGGPDDLLERPDTHLAKAPFLADVPAARDGIISAIDTRAVGFAVVRLGGGRIVPQAAIDHAVGFDRLLPVGTTVRKREPIARVHAADAAAAAAASAALCAAFSIGERPPKAQPPIERIS